MKTILCPTDFSAGAANAIVYAHQLAIQAQARLILLHTIFQPDAMPYAGMSISQKESAAEVSDCQEELLQLCRQLELHNHQTGVRYEIKVGTRPAVDEITHTASSEQADMIVIGTSGAHGLKEILLGSTAASVIEMTKRPVLVVPDTAAFHPVEQIVFAADLTNKHPCSLTELVSMARLFNARILFLHVLTKKSLLKSNLARVHYSDLYSLTGYEKVSFHIREDTDIEKGILDFSREKKADLIVMINHEKNLLESLFLGSHTKQMAYHSPLPLLAIHT